MYLFEIEVTNNNENKAITYTTIRRNDIHGL